MPVQAPALALSAQDLTAWPPRAGVAGMEPAASRARPLEQHRRPFLYRTYHNTNLAALLDAVEQWQRQLFELVEHTTNEREEILLGQLLGQAFIMRDKVLRLRVMELARVLRHRGVASDTDLTGAQAQ